MGFADFERYKDLYTDELMSGNIQRLLDFEPFHCLLSGGVSTALQAGVFFERLPKSYLSWLKICDGGLLFDTVMLSTKNYDKELDLEFDTYEDYNTPEAKAIFGLPEGYGIFAVRNYGDPLCFNTAENDGRVYLWDTEEQDFDDIWDTFEDWLTEEIDIGIELIADGTLEPLGIKTCGEDDE